MGGAVQPRYRVARGLSAPGCAEILAADVKSIEKNIVLIRAERSLRLPDAFSKQSIAIVSSPAIPSPTAERLTLIGFEEQVT